MNNASMTHKYVPRIDSYENNLFVEEYYSSPDTKIYIDGEEQTEIGYINYSIQEQLKPLYGYSARTFDDVAVGTRIVTGMFKVPIKNPMAQSTLGEIIASQGLEEDTVSDYNDSQEELMKYHDWITNTDVTTEDVVFVNNDDVYPYISKLMMLGYDIDYNSTTEELKEAVKQFQKDHDKDRTSGMLTQSVKNAIDEAFESVDIKEITIPAGTKIYSGPDDVFDVVATLLEDKKAYIINDKLDDWFMIRVDDTIEGFIKKDILE